MHFRLIFEIAILSLLMGVTNGSPRYGDCFNNIAKDIFVNDTSKLHKSIYPSYNNNITRLTKNSTDSTPIPVPYNSCEKNSHGWEPYDTMDILERISLWIVPLLVLIGNFHMAPLGSLNSIYSGIHLLGDPIDTMSSLLTKLEVSKRLYTRWVSVSVAGKLVNEHDDQHVPMSTQVEKRERAALEITAAQARDLATVNSVFDDRLFSTNKVFETMLSALISLDDQRRKIFITACIEAAHRLSESRVDELRRTAFAIAGYVVAIIASFLKSLITDSKRNCALDIPSCSPLDRKTAYSIAFALSMSWLIPAVFLSSMVGGFTSNRAAARIIRDLKAEIDEFRQIPDPEAWSKLHIPFSRRVVWKYCETLDNALPYGGGNYSYRPTKYLPPSKAPTEVQYRNVHGFAGDRSVTQIYIYSTLPLIIAVGCAMTVTWLTPTTGFSCRFVIRDSVLGPANLTAAPQIAHATWVFTLLVT